MYVFAKRLSLLVGMNAYLEYRPNDSIPGLPAFSGEALVGFQPPCAGLVEPEPANYARDITKV